MIPLKIAFSLKFRSKNIVSDVLTSDWVVNEFLANERTGVNQRDGNAADGKGLSNEKKMDN